MTTQERAAMLERYDDANRWLVRVFDQTRSEEHRFVMWQFLMTTGEKRFKNILIATRQLDESAHRFWQQHGIN